MEADSSKIENTTQKHGLLASREQNVAFEAQGRHAWFRENRVGLIMAFFLLSSIPLYFGWLIYSNIRTLKTLNTPAKQGQAYIVRKDALSTGTKSISTRYEITFRLNGQQITATTLDPVKWAQTPTETTVPVTYHVGENGEILISDWQTTPVQ